IANLGQKSAIERVASYLIFLNNTHQENNLDGDHLCESLTRVELADMLGVTQRTLIRCLKKMESDNIIGLTREGFVINDYSTLLHISEGN
ncbi:MAG: helix-turn-helix domain-containing protein, partial [Gammaproteobacteria bacterium]|nr:helix-turn-helix domain-containing protein [Gammaproteobacteria bacterium]